MTATSTNHLVLAGGGPSCVTTLGVLQQLEINGRLNPRQIRTIYASSSGAIAAVYWCLHRDANFDWPTINDFMIQRPWEDVFAIQWHNILDIFTTRGIFHTDTFLACFHSFLQARGISETITLREFHDKWCDIDLHVFALELNAFVLEDVSWLTHPNVTLMTALHMTCSLPMIFSPVMDADSGKCYMDGGIVSNYPLRHCVAAVGADNVGTILGIKNVYDRSGLARTISTASTLLEYMLAFVFKIVEFVQEKDDDLSATLPAGCEIECQTDFLSLEYIQAAVCNETMRGDLLRAGVDIVSGLAAAVSTKTET